MKRKALFLVLLLFAEAAFAQVTLDSTTSVAITTVNTTHTLSGIVIGNNPNRLLLLGMQYQNGDGTTYVTDCTFNTTEAMTKLAAINNVTGGNSSYIWYLKNPSATTGNIVCSSSVADRSALGALSLYNVDQTFTFRDSDTLTADSVTSSGNITLTTVAGDYTFTTIYVGSGSQNPTDLVPGGSQTERWDLALSGLNRGGGSTFVATGTSTNLSYTWTGNDYASMVGTAVQPAAGAGSGPLFKRYYDLLRN